MKKAESKTTTVGLVVGDYVVLAADKRATAGPMVYHKAVKKISRITDYAALTISGLVADAQYIVEYARFLARDYEAETGKPISVGALASRISLVLSVYLRYVPFIVQLLLGGRDHTGASLYYMDLYGSVTREKYMATGSGSPVAFGVLEQGYRSDLSLEEAKALAFKAVSSAIMRDGFTGEGVDVVVIGPQGYMEETIPLKRIVEEAKP
ncbi:proteasome subunit beta [Desulfurococcus mucosus]|uniref:Proteasome subunit beta n=1 Tax=Desulfurococcus mucosus (strain ATCC 35584 / DSM 2162 / JCM 9187 / O7/1) TaxID=765177 RepID=E8R7A5_DESM0|nr:proteasome subunit beta [Desulfurococcus mucosus]ADV65570.1 proteasome endopeptidase complex, beta component [Desulfurococcus mucosus DSM 2162]